MEKKLTLDELENKPVSEQARLIKEEMIKDLKVMNYSNHTISSYNRELNRFIDFLKEKYDDKIDITDINRFIILQALDYRGNVSSRTKQLFLDTLKRFFVFIEEEIDQQGNYTRMFRKIKIKVERKEAEYLNDEEINRLLNTLEEMKRKAGNYRKFKPVILTKLLYYCGLRSLEALNIKKKDITTITNGDTLYKIRIMGKGKKEAYVYIKKSIIDELDDYLNMLNDDDYLFTTRSGRKMTHTEAYIMVKRIFKKAGINKTGLHILRHSIAMKLLREGIDITRIQKLLRHANIRTTSIYAHATENDTIRLAIAELINKKK